MYSQRSCPHCSGGTQYYHPDKLAWGKIPNHMLHKVREPGGDIIFNAERLYTGYRDCAECNGRGYVYRLKESEVD
jgi:hypothetical protein